MKISIITATYNSAKNLANCLQSVAGQDYPHIEHIVVDGGSIDGTMEIVKSFPSVTKSISEPDKGIYDALNKGIRLATGDVIGFVHSDDMLASPNIISHIALKFSHDSGVIESIPEEENSASSPLSGGDVSVRNAGGRQRGSRGRVSISINKNVRNVDGVYGNLVFVDPENTDKVIRTWISTPFDRRELKHGWMPPHPTLFLRREVYEKHGLFDISFKIAGDYDFMLRVMCDPEIRLQLLPETIVKMRHGGASTGSLRQILKKMQEDLRALRNNGFRFPLWVLAMKNLRKLPQLLHRS